MLWWEERERERERFNEHEHQASISPPPAVSFPPRHYHGILSYGIWIKEKQHHARGNKNSPPLPFHVWFLIGQTGVRFQKPVTWRAVGADHTIVSPSCDRGIIVSVTHQHGSAVKRQLGLSIYLGSKQQYRSNGNTIQEEAFRQEDIPLSLWVPSRLLAK